MVWGVHFGTLEKTQFNATPYIFYQAIFFFLLANQRTCVQLRAPKQFDNLLITFKQYFNIINVYGHCKRFQALLMNK
jgi:hypothetical protein